MINVVSWSADGINLSEGFRSGTRASRISYVGCVSFRVMTVDKVATKGRSRFGTRRVDGRGGGSSTISVGILKGELGADIVAARCLIVGKREPISPSTKRPVGSRSSSRSKGVGGACPELFALLRRLGRRIIPEREKERCWKD